MKQLLLFFFLFVLLTGLSRAGEADSLLQQGHRLFLQSDYSGALSVYTALAHRAETNRNDTFYIKAITGIGDCHYYLRDKQTALRWYHTALASINDKSIHNMASTLYYKISVMFIESGKTDSSKFYANRAIRLFRQEKNNVSLSRSLSALADIHLNVTGDYQKAEELIEEALRTALKTGNPEVIGFAYMKRTLLNYTKQRYQQALQDVNQAEYFYLQTNKQEDIQYARYFKTYCLIRLRDTSAIGYIEQWFRFKDSIFQVEKAGQIAKIQTVYETEKKERENKILQQQAQISQLQLKTRNRTIFILLALLAGAGMFGFWRYNAARLKKKQQELKMLEQLQKDKERIARDLHDHVGGQLSFLVHAIEGITEEPAEKRLLLKKSILVSLRKVIAGLRETIWAIHDEKIEVTDFMDKLKVFTRSLFEHSNTQIHFSEALLTEKDLNPLLALNLFRICQEIIQNTFKHAQATELWVSCREEASHLYVEIRDNGTGFDVSTNYKHTLGLQNIQSRAKEFQIQLHLESNSNGTFYQLIV